MKHLKAPLGQLTGFLATGQGAGGLAVAMFFCTQSLITYSAGVTYICFWLSFTPLLRLNGASRFGDFSYGLYSCSFPIQKMLYAVYPVMPPLLNVIGATLCSLAAAVLSWHLIERRALGAKTAAAQLVGQLSGSAWADPASPEAIPAASAHPLS